LALAALVWPGHLAGPLDGAPLDRPFEAVVLGLIAPLLWWLHPAFLRSRLVRGSIVALFILKVGAAALVQDGWCLSFEPPMPMVRDGRGKPHSWDIRADWRAGDPRCSAVMTRSYADIWEFPAWFFNLPPPNDATTTEGYRPGQPHIRFTASGFFDAPADGTLIVDTDPGMQTAVAIDGQDVSSVAAGRHEVALAPGIHEVKVNADLGLKTWRLIPSWNGTRLASLGFPAITVTRPSTIDLLVRPAGNWVLFALPALLIAAWLLSFAIHVRESSLMVWLAASSLCMLFVAFLTPNVIWGGFAVIALALGVPVSSRFHDLRGATMLFGVPWLAYIAASNIALAGRWTIYGIGNDEWQFQRFAYRIFLQGYWLEGGQVTFWLQPLYRWLVGALHIVFGDSSLGQTYLDAASVLVMALFAFQVTMAVAGFRWGIAAAVVMFATVFGGPTRGLVGYGLTEIASAGFIYLAATLAMRSRSLDLGASIATACTAALGFLTRLNNLPMAAAVAVLALPLTLESYRVLEFREWGRRVPKRLVISVFGALALSALLIAWRTWYYTGVFGLFYGTQREHLQVWRPGMSVVEGVTAMGSSLMMVLTASDPPRYAHHALPLLVGAAVSLLALVGVARLKLLPLSPVMFFWSGCLSPLFARGFHYEGRFSVHLLGVGSALTVCAVAHLAQRASSARSYLS
jgi:hypothetical protein